MDSISFEGYRNSIQTDSLIAENYQKYNKQLEHLARELEDSYLDENLAGAFEEYER